MLPDGDHLNQADAARCSIPDGHSPLGAQTKFVDFPANTDTGSSSPIKQVR